jgi:hypothetical protein
MKRATIIALTSAAALAIALAVVALTADRAVAQSTPTGPRPFQIQRNFFTTTSTFSEPIFTTPPGTMLVIEHLSASVTVPPGQKVLGISMVASIGSGQPFVQHWAPLAAQGASQFSDFYIVSQPIRAHSGPNQTVFLSGIRNNASAGGQITVLANITGYLVTCASPTDCRLP